MDGSNLMELVFRGKSAHPLYVTTAGMDVKVAAAAVAAMHGKHRIPDILRITDHLARGIDSC